MPNQLIHVRIDVSGKVFLKDPCSSILGKQILESGLPMIIELGMEGFTFRKLAQLIGTTESAIYRYFENKHKLLLYYVSWYWGWLEYNLAFGTANVALPEIKLETAIRILTGSLPPMHNAPFNLTQLQEVVISESSKAYLTKEVDDENRDGLFVQFKNLCARVSSIIQELAPEYPYAHSLTSLFIESYLDQLFFKAHLSSLTDLHKSEDASFEFYKEIIFSSLERWRK